MPPEMKFSNRREYVPTRTREVELVKRARYADSSRIHNRHRRQTPLLGSDQVPTRKVDDVCMTNRELVEVLGGSSSRVAVVDDG